MKVEQVRKMLKNHEVAWEAIEYLECMAVDGENDDGVYVSVKQLKNSIHYLENKILELEEYVEEVNS